jgi:spore coat polysaccharide biosynthesis protein SpsF
MNVKTVAIIQARMGSTRLPGKIMLPLGGTTVLDHVVMRSRKISGLTDVIVATSVLSQDDAVEEWARRQGVYCFRGSEDDVLSRYYECARLHRPDFVMRITADCPYLDDELGTAMIEEMRAHPCDIIRLDGEMPRGLEPQLVSFSALEWMHEHAREPRHREHVTYYAYEFPERFRTRYIAVPERMRHPELRITIDTPEDYQLMQKIAERFRDGIGVSASEIVAFLLDHPEVAAINAHIRQKPVV